MSTNLDINAVPRFRCHKEVRALKIQKIEPADIGGAIITPVDASIPPFNVDAHYVRQHVPQPGGYFVIYDDGYESWSPEAAFENGYVKLT